MTYQPPKLEEVGSVRELTLGHGHGKSDWFGWGGKKDNDHGGGGIS